MSLEELYENDGFVVVSNLFDSDECENLKIEGQRILAEKALPEASVYVHASVSSELYSQYHRDPRLINLISKLMPTGVMFLSDKIVVKTSEKTFATPWHIDRFYWPETRPKLSVWIPLDDANEDNGTLTVVRGSHKKNWTKQTKALPNGEFLYQVADQDVNKDDVVICNVLRGSAIVFSDLLLHGSTENRACIDRFALISTYHAPVDDEEFDLSFPAREKLVLQ